MSVPDVPAAAGPSSQKEAAEEKTADSIDRLYYQQIWKNLVQQDIARPPIYLQSTQLDFRAALVKKIQDIAKKLHLSAAICHSAVALLDSFMDRHLLRSDRLYHVALACLSLAGKCEENSYALSLKVLSKIGEMHICGKIFRRIEWMVAQHVQWKLMAPTPVTFASMLTQFLVTDNDVKNRSPTYASKLRSLATKLLDAYLDLTLCDVHLKLLNSVYVGCACVASTRTDIYLSPWPSALEAYTGISFSSISSISRRLQRMMTMVKSRQKSVESDADNGYGSIESVNTPLVVPPKYQPQPATRGSTGSFASFSYVTVQANHHDRTVNKVERENIKANAANPPQPIVACPFGIDMAVVDRRTDPTDPLYNASRKLVTANPQPANPQPSTSGVKRGSLQTNVDFKNKKMRL